MNPAILALLTFLACVAAIAGAYSLLSDLFLRDRARVKQRMQEAIRTQTRALAKESLLVKSAEAIEDAVAEGRQREKPGLGARLQTMLDQSGLHISRRRLLVYCAAAAGLAGLIAGLAQGNPWVALVASLVAFPLPIVYVRFKRNARMEALRRQLSDAFDLMARVLRAGQSMAQAMHGVAAEFTSPIAEEFAFCSEQMNLGLSPEISLRGLARRSGIVELNIFVVAVLVQRQVGGNLSEILEKIAEVVRERYRIRGVIRGVTAEGRLQAMILMALPPFLFCLMLLVNYDYARELLEMPALLVGIAFFMGVGALWIRKIVNIDI